MENNQPVSPPPANQPNFNPVPNVPVTPPVSAPPFRGGPLKMLLNKKIIFAVLGIVVLVEVVWAVSSLMKPKPTPVASSPSSSAVAITKVTSATLIATPSAVKVGDKINVKINLSSQVKSDGVDMIILYDPKLLSVESASAATPVKTGSLFSSYPQNKLDDKLGRIAVSGIADQAGGVLANGSLGEVTFVAKTAGKTKITLDFTPGSASDSNIVETGTGNDVLGKVGAAEVIIQ